VIKKLTASIFILFSITIIGWLQFKDPYMNASNAAVITMESAKDLYISNCSSCHMDNLAGNPNWKSSLDVDGQRLPPPLNGSGHTWHHSPQQLFDTIRFGYKKIDPEYQGKMLGNENLTDDEIWSILEYIKSIWPEKIKAKYYSNFSK
jgi:mono/diheme cytochrome c family protein